MARIALDAGVVIGLLDGRDVHHEAAAEVLRQHAADDLRMPVSAYAEVLARPAAEGRLDEVRKKIVMLGIAIDPIDAEIAERAAVFRGASKSLALADAFVLGYADVVDAEVLTTDRRLARLSSRVRVVR